MIKCHYNQTIMSNKIAYFSPRQIKFNKGNQFEFYKEWCIVIGMSHEKK